MGRTETTPSSITAHRIFRPQRYPALVPIVSGEDVAPSLADRVMDSILQRIVLGKIAVGEKLRTTELAKSLSVSRTPVAKAIAKLVADGILVQPNNHQAIVAPRAENWLLEIHALRQIIEPEAACLAAGQIPANVLEDLGLLMEDAEPDGSERARQAAQYFDFALHLSIAEFCGNLPIGITIRKCWTYKRLAFGLFDDGMTAMKAMQEQHRAILIAVAKGSGTAARKEMTRHLTDARNLNAAERIV